MTEPPKYVDLTDDNKLPETIANRNGRCTLCDDKIYEEDTIVLYEDEWCHKECVEREV